MHFVILLNLIVKYSLVWIENKLILMYTIYCKVVEYMAFTHYVCECEENVF